MHNLKLTLLLLLLTDIQTSLAQKHDYMWPLGLRPEVSEFRFYYDFKTSDIVIRADTVCNAIFSASFCDADGNILFFSNGLGIFDRHGSILENGGGLNPTLTEWQTASSYPAGQSGFFLQKPDDPNLLYFISLDFGPHPAQKWPYMFVGQNLVTATIDIGANNGTGKVIEKNEILLTGTLMSPAACRHANGRDWWILVSNADENIHYRILLSPEGFSMPDTQLIGTKPNPIPYNGGDKGNQIVGNCFSPQGRYYADINDKLGFSIFEFDRCSGLLSNEKREDLPPNPLNPNHYPYYSGTGAVFSGNEQFFYKTTTNPGGYSTFAPTGTRPYLYQYDLSVPDMAASRDTINILDSADYHFPSNITWEKFLGAELGPDGRIYIVHSGLGYNTVQYPNLKGRDCKLVDDKPFFGVVIGSAIPYMPNYRLGPLDGSPCDTLGLNNIPVANFRVDDTLGFLSRYFYDLSHHEPATWFWDFGDGTISQDTSPVHLFPAPGTYTVCLTVCNDYACDTLCREVTVGASGTTETATDPAGYHIYPNPTATSFTLRKTSGVFTGGEPVVLYNSTGQVLASRQPARGETSLVFGVESYPPGVYWLRVEGVVMKVLRMAGF